MSIIRDDIRISENLPTIEKTAAKEAVKEESTRKEEILSEKIVLSDKSNSVDLTKQEMYELQEVYNYSEVSKDAVKYINSQISLINKEIHQCAEKPSQIDYESLTKSVKKHLKNINTSIEQSNFNGKNQIKQSLSKENLEFISNEDLIIRNKKNIQKVNNMVKSVKSEVLDVYEATKNNIERTSKVLNTLNSRNLQVVEIRAKEDFKVNTQEIKENAVSSISSQVTYLDRNLLLAMVAFFGK